MTTTTDPYHVAALYVQSLIESHRTAVAIVQSAISNNESE